VVRILNMQGIRADESPARAKKVPFKFDEMASNGKRHIDTWYPIFDWTVEEVWTTIRQSGVRHHFAYDLGMPRLSCCFCVLASEDALILAGHHNKELLAEYVAVEKKIGHTFKKSLPIAKIQERVEAGEMPKKAVGTWCM
jgi:3'-phosphoadenosine 5'-phosphosulfate sulfotransferase (PAPS reductase)/FAD synthetase